MALTDGDKAECKEIAREIIKEVLIEHVAGCPHGIKIVKNKMFLVGMMLGVGVGSGAIGGGVVIAITKLFAGI